MVTAKGNDMSWSMSYVRVLQKKVISTIRSPCWQRYRL